MKDDQHCDLGGECPYAGSMRWLHDERLRREQTQGEQAVAIDRLADKLQKAILQVETFELKIAGVAETFRLQVLAVTQAQERHERRHRIFELATLSLAASIGALFAHLAK